MGTENLLYLDFARFEDGKALRGGALVVDPSTEPLEFRCTTAVRPTRLQRVLWGAPLEGHIAADLVARPLIQSLQQEYSLIVIRDADFFDIRDKSDIPVVLLKRDIDIELEEGEAKQAQRPDKSGETAASAPGGTEGKGELSDTLTNPTGHFEPVILRCHPKHREDAVAARQLLAPVFARRDVLEPFERIATALQTIQIEETKKAED